MVCGGARGERAKKRIVPRVALLLDPLMLNRKQFFLLLCPEHNRLCAFFFFPELERGEKVTTRKREKKNAPGFG